MTVLNPAEIESEKWQKAISNFPHKSYMDLDWLNLVSNKKWAALVWEDYKSVFPIVYNKKYTIPYAYTPSFIQQFTTSSLSNSQIESLLKFLKKKFLIADIQSDSPITSKSIPKSNLIISKKNISIPEIQSKYSSLLKKNIEKSNKFLQFKEENISVDFLDLYIENDFFKKFTTIEPINFYTFVQKFPEKFKIYTARIEGEIVGQVTTLYSDEREYLLLPISSQLGRDTQAMSGLMDYIISNSRSQILDFEGSNIPTIKKFYQQFNPEEEKYYYSRITYLT